jgi:hypothetical protein
MCELQGIHGKISLLAIDLLMAVGVAAASFILDPDVTVDQRCSWPCELPSQIGRPCQHALRAYHEAGTECLLTLLHWCCLLGEVGRLELVSRQDSVCPVAARRPCLAKDLVRWEDQPGSPARSLAAVGSPNNSCQGMNSI